MRFPFPTKTETMKAGGPPTPDSHSLRAAMRRSLALLATVALSAAALMLGLLEAGGGTAQELVMLGADTNATGNTATSLGPHENCRSVAEGDTFPLDLFVSDVQDLVHWELYVKFDPSILEVTDADPRLFLATNPRSSLTVQSIPLSGGRYFLGAADTHGAPESGSGVLARLTMHAKSPGLSGVTIPSTDADGDGRLDLGPRLTAQGGYAVNDVTGDGIFDGPTFHALIAVGRSCDDAPVPTPSLPPSPTPGAGGGGSGGGTGSGGGGTGSGDDGSADGTPSASGPNAEATETAGAGGSPQPAVLRDERTPGISSDGGGSAAGVRGGQSSSSDDGLPFWAIGFIAAGVLVAGGGTGVYLARRFTPN